VAVAWWRGAGDPNLIFVSLRLCDDIDIEDAGVDARGTLWRDAKATLQKAKAGLEARLTLRPEGRSYSHADVFGDECSRCLDSIGAADQHSSVGKHRDYVSPCLLRRREAQHECGVIHFARSTQSFG